MNFREFELGGKKLRISAFSDNAVRIRISDDFKPTYFERYKIYNEPDENAGELLTNGIKAGDLAVTYENGVITMKSPRFERKISLDNSAVAEKSKLFNEKLTDFRPERKKIVGDTSEDEAIEYVNFEKDPKYITVKTEGEIFYGLGESNTDRIVLNGRTYLERVIYVRSEIVIPFLMTKAGYGVLCNSTIWHGVDVCDENENEICWFLPDGDIDFYLFAGDSLKAILERFTYVTGRPMVLPKWGYGLTFIDQYFADQFEVMHNAEKFREKKIPCDTFSLEPGWMGGYDFSTQKKWYTQRFYICDWMRRTEEEFAAHTPRERQFTTALSRYGFKLLLWLCCKYDFTANQENRAGNPTDFGIEPWYKHLKSFVCDGAAGFKMDPCKVVDTATETRVYANGEGEPYMHSLQCTLYGKEMYEGYSEYTGLRPMHHMSGGYTSMSRYSATTTGDSGGKHKTLVWILNSGLSGMSNITCDMDIFAKHTIHYCFFTAWCQLNSWSGYSHPWWAGDELEAIFTFYDKLRYRLLPYIYSAAIESHISGTPVVRAMPLEFEDKALVNATCEYMFGDSMLVGSFSDTIYLPEGEVWINAWNGELVSGGREVNIDVPENRGGPLYIRGGAIIPTQAEKQFTDCKDDEHLTLEIYPVEACDTAYTLYEDDGRTQAYLRGERAKTEFTLRMICGKATLTISRREGSFDGMAAERSYGVKAYAVSAPKAVFVDGKATDFTYADGFASFEAGTASEVTIEFLKKREGMIMDFITKPEYERFTAADREKRLQWFKEARFGMFIHYSLFSQHETGEWCMYQQDYTKAEYEEFAKAFSPKEGCADEWCALAKKAGAKYAVLTTRHHEGFSLWKSDVNPYNSYNYCGRDIVREFVDACRKYGLRIGLYSSLMDWHHPDGWRCAFDPEARRRFLDYIEALNAELLSNYGKIDILWYDMPYPMTSSEGWDSVNRNYRLRKLQPDILINNRSKIQEDFLTPEERVNPADGAYWEACMTFNGISWGYLDAEQVKPYSYTPQQIIRMLNTCTAGGGNLLLNIGPKADGSIPEEAVKPLEVVGAWLAENGEAVYGEKAIVGNNLGGCALNVPSASPDCTKIYLWNRIWKSGELRLGGYMDAPKSVTVLATGEKIDFEMDGHRIILKNLPEKSFDRHANIAVIKLEFDKSPRCRSGSYYPQMRGGENVAGDLVQ